MLSTLISIAGIVITLLFVVGTHEAAHFLAARALGVKGSEILYRTKRQHRRHNNRCSILACNNVCL